MNGSTGKWMISTAAIVLGVLLTAGCNDGGAKVQVRAEADVRTAVEQRATQVARLIGVPLDEKPLVSRSPCTGDAGESDDDVNSLIGIWTVGVPADRQLNTLDQVEDDWSAKSWRITEQRQVSPTRGVLTAVDPAGYEINLTSTTESDGFRVMISSPCFASDPTS